MALPTKEELVIVETFRGKVADILTDEEASDDMFLLRWLRARDLDMVKAEKMLRNAIKWRKENNMDTILKEKSVDPYYRENFPRWIEGIDKGGRPVMTTPFGKWDVRKVVSKGKSNEFVNYLSICFEEMSESIKICATTLSPAKPGTAPVTQFTAIMDWEGMAWSQLLSYQAIQNFLQIGAIYEAYYPEILHQCIFINCPSIISTVLLLLKPVIAPRTMEKIKVYGTDKKVWTEEILKIVDADQLRPQYGGTKNDDKNPFQF